MTTIPVTIKNNYSSYSSRLTIFFNSYFEIMGNPYFTTFTTLIESGQTYYGSKKNPGLPPNTPLNFAYANSQVYIFYYDSYTKNYGIFQSIIVPQNAYSLNITLVNSCEIQRTVSGNLSAKGGDMNIQVGYISNNINSYIKSTSCSDQNGCWLYGTPPYCICVDTDKLQEDINSGVVGCV